MPFLITVCHVLSGAILFYVLDDRFLQLGIAAYEHEDVIAGFLFNDQADCHVRQNGIGEGNEDRIIRCSLPLNPFIMRALIMIWVG